MGAYGLQQILSRTTTKAMIIVQSTFGSTARLNTSCSSIQEFDPASAFFLVILATSRPSLPRILQFLLLKQPSTKKLLLGPWPVVSSDALPRPDIMNTSASWPFRKTEHLLIEKS
jgi:hypothetical protein